MMAGFYFFISHFLTDSGSDFSVQGISKQSTAVFDAWGHMGVCLSGCLNGLCRPLLGTALRLDAKG